MRKVGNAVQQYYGQITITPPNPNGGVPPLTVLAPNTGDTVSVSGISGQGILVSATDLPRIATFAGGTVVTSMRSYVTGLIGLIGTQTNHALGLRTNDIDRIRIENTGNVTINAPSSGTALSVTGSNTNSSVATITANSSSGNSFGLGVNAGTTAADAALRISNQAANTAYFYVYGNGSVIVGNPSGGVQGLGTINAQGLYVNGVAVPGAPITGTFTGTLTGCTTSPTAVFRYSISGNKVTISLSVNLSATSNSVICNVTGIPLACQPIVQQTFACPGLIDSGFGNLMGTVTINPSSTMTLGLALGVTIPGGTAMASGAQFNTTGTKGLESGFSITYCLF